MVWDFFFGTEEVSFTKLENFKFNSQFSVKKNSKGKKRDGSGLWQDICYLP